VWVTPSIETKCSFPPFNSFSNLYDWDANSKYVPKQRNTLVPVELGTMRCSIGGQQQHEQWEQEEQGAHEQWGANNGARVAGGTAARVVW